MPRKLGTTRVRSRHEHRMRPRMNFNHVTVTSMNASTLIAASALDREESRGLFPPFAKETALQKVQSADGAWNICDPHRKSRWERA